MRKALRRSDRGSAIVELALTLPVLVMIMVAAIDFARVFYLGIALTNAARAGAQWGAHVLAQSANNSVMQTTALNAFATTNMSGVTAVATRSCECATNGGTFSPTSPPNNCAYTCTGSHLVVNVTVTMSAPFTRLIPGVPGIPTSMTVTRSATMRALP